MKCQFRQCACLIERPSEIIPSRSVNLPPQTCKSRRKVEPGVRIISFASVAAGRGINQHCKRYIIITFRFSFILFRQSAVVLVVVFIEVGSFLRHSPNISPLFSVRVKKGVLHLALQYTSLDFVVKRLHPHRWSKLWIDCPQYLAGRSGALRNDFFPVREK